MLSSWSRVPWSVTYLARRTAGVSLLLAEQVGVTLFPSAPPREEAWAAGYAAATRSALDDVDVLAATRT